MAIDINIPSQVKTFANLAAFPATGALKTIYIAEDTNKTYRWTGSVYVEVSAAGATGITIGTTAITSGTVGRVLFEGTGNVVQESANLFWDNTNGRLGIGTSTPSVKAHVVYNDNTFLNGLYVQNTSVLSSSYTGIGLQDSAGTVKAGFQFIPSTFSFAGLQNTVIFASITQSRLAFIANSSAVGATAQDIYFSTLGSNTTYQMQIKANGNVQIGTNTDAGFRLDVNGTARVSGNAQFGTGFYWDNTNNRLGVGISSPLAQFHMSNTGAGTNTTFRMSVNPVSANAILFTDTGGAEQGGVSGTGASFSFGTYRTLQTTLSGGAGGVGLRTGNGANAHISFYSGNADSNLSTERVRLVASTGNLLINTTTDAGFKLDVNGTARVSDNLLLTNGIIATSTATTRLQGSLNYFTHNRIASSGLFGFQISSYGTLASFWRWSDATYDTEIGGAGSPLIGGLKLFTAGTEKMYIASGGQVGIGTSTPNANAALELSSTTRGFLPPRMTTTQKNAIALPAAGLQIYDTTLNRPCFYDGTTWITL
jgi:hypothetical protein